MGQAKRRKALRDTLLSDGAVCIFCGGTEPATTVDHVPPRVMFDRSHRPKGMEFPACQACNSGSRQAEQVAAMLARTWPDPATGLTSDEQEKLIRAVSNNVPGLLEEMAPTTQQRVLYNAQRQFLPSGTAGFLNAGGPILNQAMMTFGAKLGMALFSHDLGRALPSEGAIFVRWYSNHDAITDRLPLDVVRMMGTPASLQQGRWTVGDQFVFRSAIPIERTMVAHMTTFRQSYGILTFAAADGRHMDRAPQNHVFRPGCLRT